MYPEDPKPLPQLTGIVIREVSGNDNEPGWGFCGAVLTSCGEFESKIPVVTGKKGSTMLVACHKLMILEIWWYIF